MAWIAGAAMVASGWLVGCAGGGATTGGSSGSGSSTDGSGGSGGSVSSSTGGGLGTTGPGSGGSTGSGDFLGEVYGHGPDTLYRLDPVTKAVTTVGDFTGCESVIDLAINKDNELFATSFEGLFRIDKNTANCTLVSTGEYPNSLSFVPEGTVLPNSEALVGYNEAAYVRIDTTTGAVTPVGQLGGGYVSSGDIVSVIGGGTYLTVDGNGCGDCLVEVNPTTGALVKNYGSVSHAQVFGLAYWGGSAYGFSNDGALFEITFNVDNVSTTAISIPGAPMDLQFWGAGSSTKAPLAPPN